MIREAKPAQIDEILKLTRACANKMIAENIYQWNEDYPSREAFEKDIERGELYIYTQGKKILGTIVISTFKDAVYEQVEWVTPADARCIYIHRLAVHPDCQGQGIGQDLMNHAETIAKENDYDSVRLDTFSKNKGNNTFYQKRGYQRLQEIYFPKQSEFPFYCYELVL
ncbi:MAG: GNAT family N-acetyltransferase [Leeuwenhoekiella sp.]